MLEAMASHNNAANTPHGLQSVLILRKPGVTQANDVWGWYVDLLVAP